MTQKSDDPSKIPDDILRILAEQATRTEAKETELAAKQRRLLDKLRSNATHAASTSSSLSAAQPSPQDKTEDSAPAQPETGFELLLQRIAFRAERFTPEEKEMIEAFGFSTGAPPKSDDTK